MSIIRAPRPEANFYMLNKAISEDYRLSWAARGLLVYLLGKPDHWAVSVTHLRNETAKSSKPTGRDGVYGLLQELISTGYVARQQGRSNDGLLGEIIYLVSETPLTALPYTDEPYPAAPYPANPTLVSIDGKQVLKKEVSTDSEQALANAHSQVKVKARNTKFDPMSAKPGNVDAQVWADWCQHRKEIRKPLTATTCAQQAKKLAGHQAPNQVLETSIANGWSGIFPDKVLNSTAKAPSSRHNGFSNKDYTVGLKQREDGTYAL